MLTLMYHNVLATPNLAWPVAGGQITEATFRNQMRRVRRRLLHPLDVCEALNAGRVPKGVLVTFDDGAAGVQTAAGILAELGAAGVAFICPGAIEGGLWFYRLAAAIVRSPHANLVWDGDIVQLRSDADRRRAYGTWSPRLFSLPVSQRDALCDSLVAALGGDPVPPPTELRLLDEAGLQATAATGGMFFANHSWSHPDLAALAGEDLAVEVDRAQAWLVSSGLPLVPWFAFPRGSHSPAVLDCVGRRYQAAFGVNASENVAGVMARVYLRDMDSARLRFWYKTVCSGRLYGAHQRWWSGRHLIPCKP